MLFIAGFLVAVYIYLPWRDVGKFAMSIAHTQMQKRGMRLNYSEVTGPDGGFTVNDLTVSGMANITLSSVTLKPDLATSLMSIAPVCGVKFQGGNVRLGQTLNFGDGEFILTAGREIALDELKTNGEFRLNGYVTIDPSAMRIGHADAQLEVPESFSSNMGMLKNFLPLEEDGGKWYLRRR